MAVAIVWIESRFHRIGVRSISLYFVAFLTANRYPPSDQVRGHASPKNALAAIRASRIKSATHSRKWLQSEYRFDRIGVRSFFVFSHFRMATGIRFA
jgi:hypothetical protein